MFSSSRLKIARRRRGLSKAELAARSGINARSLGDYERGASPPEHSTIGVLARSLDFPIDFFLAPEIELPIADAASFRAMSRMTARQRDAALAAGALAIEFARWLDRRFELPTPEVPDLGNIDPEVAAQTIRELWGLGERPIRNVIHLLEHQGIRVFSLVEQCLEVDAFSIWHEGTPYVFLNMQKSVEHSRFDAAHELGHLVLHRHAHSGCIESSELLDEEEDHSASPAIVGRALENEANRFASALLMPRASMLSTVPIAPQLSQLVEIKHSWRVSLSALVYRAHVLDIITEWHYRNLCIELSRLGYRTHEPEPLEIRETSQVLAKVFVELKANGNTRTDIARSLRISTRDLDAMIFGLALAAVDGGDDAPPKPRPNHLKLV
jgi:Zn-dependent peptidase ImmA (M78 family)/DNA-binding XRE family transcriptional regulator